MEDYERVSFPSSRIGTLDVGRIAMHKHHVVGLLEVDVTDAIAMVRAGRSEGGGASFTAWVVHTIGSAIAENRYVHAQRAGKRSVVVHRDVDISVMVEREVAGTAVPLPVLIRKTNEKSAEEVHREIESAKKRTITGEADYVLTDAQPPRWLMRIYYAMPQRVRLFGIRRMLANPHRAKKLMGTAIVTSVGAPGHLSAWIIPKAMHGLCFALGPVVKKPWVVRNNIEIRSILNLTVLVDHDVVDGMPAVRFIGRLAGRLQRPL